jgi:hypothetical protein
MAITSKKVHEVDARLNGAHSGRATVPREVNDSQPRQGYKAEQANVLSVRER